ncbi:MAG: TetR/AcrR family transcriptional regulator [bacterium]
MSPKIVDKDEKKKQIVKAAMSVFAQKGLNNTKMIDIAQAASIGKGTIYEYFRSKDEIFREAFKLFKDETDTEIGKRMFLLTDPKEKLVVFVQASFEVYLKYAEFVEVLFDFWAEGIRERDKKADLQLKQLYQEYRQYIAAILDEGIQTGAFRKMNSTLVASTIFGAMDGLTLQWILSKQEFPIIEAGKEFLETILKGIETK